MGITDFFRKKKKPTYDITNIKVQDLDIGFVFDYNMTSWAVEAVYEYDWGDEYFTREFRVNNGNERHFLSLEDDEGELSLAMMQKVKVRSIKSFLPELLIEDQKPPKEIEYNGVVYYLEEEAAGYFNDIAKGDSWEEFRSWDFEDQEGKQLLCIEQWDTKDFEASIGVKVHAFEITNILPPEQ